MHVHGVKFDPSTSRIGSSKTLQDGDFSSGTETFMWHANTMNVSDGVIYCFLLIVKTFSL
jgi:hypothetical protein